MIDLGEFIHTIHVATASAAEALMSKNLELLESFFEDVTEAVDVDEVTRMAAAGTSDTNGAVNPKATAEAIKKSADLLAEANKAVIKEGGPGNGPGDNDGNTGGDDKGGNDDANNDDANNNAKLKSRLLKPKMVALQYPLTTKDGPRVHVVHVPLISLVPISQVQLADLKFTTELDIGLSGDTLLVSFPKAESEKGAGAGKNSDKSELKTSRASLEVAINSTTTPAGLKHLVDGFERALRAQIPG